MAEIHSVTFWESHVAACEASGEKFAAYCRRLQLNYWTFREWRKRLRRPIDSAKAPVRQALVPVIVEASAPLAVLEVRVGTQLAMSVPTSVDAVWLGTVLRAAGSC